MFPSAAVAARSELNRRAKDTGISALSSLFAHCDGKSIASVDGAGVAEYGPLQPAVGLAEQSLDVAVVGVSQFLRRAALVGEDVFKVSLSLGCQDHVLVLLEQRHGRVRLTRTFPKFETAVIVVFAVSPVLQLLADDVEVKVALQDFQGTVEVPVHTVA